MQWTGNGKSVICSPQLDLNSNKTGSCVELEISSPPQFPKSTTGTWSPEHMFTAAVCSCFMTTFIAIAENSKLDFVAFNCKANGKLERPDGKYLMSEVILQPSVTLSNEKDRERANRVLQKSEIVCLITNSVKSKVIVKPEILIEAGVAET